jgi:hypothetical protein
VPGIRDAADNYDKIYHALVTARESLESVITRRFSDQMISDAVDQTRSDATSVKQALERVSGRYNVVAKELRDYAIVLERTQNEADQAESDAQNADAAFDSASQQLNTYAPKVAGLTKTQTAYNNYTGDPDSAPSQDAVDANQRDLARAKDALRQADADKRAAESKLRAAREKLDKAIADRNIAAEDAANIIWAQINGDGQNDTWWDTWGKHVADFLASIVTDFVNAIAALKDALLDLVAALEDLATLLVLVMSGRLSLSEALLGFAECMTRVLKAVAAIGGSIAAICGTLGLVLGWVPGLGQALFAIGTLAKCTQLVINTGFAVAEGLATGHWDSLMRTGLDAAVFGVGLLLRGVRVGATDKALPALGRKLFESGAYQSMSIQGMENLSRLTQVGINAGFAYAKKGVGILADAAETPLGIAEAYNPGLASHTQPASFSPFPGHISPLSPLSNAATATIHSIPTLGPISVSTTARGEAMSEAQRANIVTSVMTEFHNPCTSFTVPSFEIAPANLVLGGVH